RIIERSLFTVDLVQSEPIRIAAFPDTYYKFGDNIEWYRLFTAPGTVYAMTGDGRIFNSVGTDFRIEERDATGTVMLTWAAPLPRARISAGDFDDLVSYISEVLNEDAREARRRKLYSEGPQATHRRAIGAIVASA